MTVMESNTLPSQARLRRPKPRGWMSSCASVTDRCPACVVGSTQPPSKKKRKIVLGLKRPWAQRERERERERAVIPGECCGPAMTWRTLGDEATL